MNKTQLQVQRRRSVEKRTESGHHHGSRRQIRTEDSRRDETGFGYLRVASVERHGLDRKQMRSGRGGTQKLRRRHWNETNPVDDRSVSRNLEEKL